MQIDAPYIVARLMRFYGMSWADALRMPATRAWTLYRQIDRLEAEEDLRQTSNIRAANSPDAGAFREHMESLAKRIGDPVKSAGPLNAERDPDAGAKLKKLAALRG